MTDQAPTDDWALRAACRGCPEGPSLFYPSTLEKRSVMATQRIARERYCNRCPVREECRTHGIEFPEYHGMWGGLGERELSLARKRWKAERDPQTA